MGDCHQNPKNNKDDRKNRNNDNHNKCRNEYNGRSNEEHRCTERNEQQSSIDQNRE